jgi:hypothetical protein
MIRANKLDKASVARYSAESLPTAVVGGEKSLWNPAKRRLAVKDTEFKLTLKGRTLSEKEKSAILGKLKKVLAEEAPGQKDVQGQDDNIVVGWSKGF